MSVLESSAVHTDQVRRFGRPVGTSRFRYDNSILRSTKSRAFVTYPSVVIVDGDAETVLSVGLEDHGGIVDRVPRRLPGSLGIAGRLATRPEVVARLYRSLSIPTTRLVAPHGENRL